MLKAGPSALKGSEGGLFGVAGGASDEILAGSYFLSQNLVRDFIEPRETEGGGSLTKGGVTHLGLS